MDGRLWTVPGDNCERVGQRLYLIAPTADAGTHEAVQQRQRRSATLPLERDPKPTNVDSTHTSAPSMRIAFHDKCR